MWKTATLRAAFALACAGSAASGLWAQSPKLDACSVLTKEDIKAVSHDVERLDPGGNREPDKVTTCYWEGYPKGSISLWSKVDPKEPNGLALKQLLNAGRKARAVPGLGDDAVFMENPDGSPGGTLFVRYSHWRLSIFRNADRPTSTAESVLPPLTALAKTAIAKLRKAG
jgi:hypothetical protein